MRKRTIAFIVITSLVVIAAICTSLFLQSRSEISDSENSSAESSLNESETKDQLEKMTDEELLQAVIDYPYLIDIFSTDHPEDAVPSLKENCAALKELIARGTAVETIDSYLAQHEKITTAEEEILRDQLIVIRDNL